MLENSNQFGFCCSDRGDISVLGNLPGFGQISLDMGRWWGDLVLKTTKTKTGKNLHTSLLFVDTIFHRLLFFPTFCWELFCSK